MMEIIEVFAMLGAAATYSLLVAKPTDAAISPVVNIMMMCIGWIGMHSIFAWAGL